jgi:hypothetical protein
MRKRRSIRGGRKEGKDEIAKGDSGVKEMQERKLKKMKNRMGQYKKGRRGEND